MTIPPEMIEAVAAAIEVARCPGREGPFGGYDYGHNTEFYGPEPEGGRYVIRDFRDPASSTWGAWVHQTHDHAEHERMFDKMTRDHVALAAIRTLAPMMAEVMAEVTMLEPPFKHGPALTREAYRRDLAAALRIRGKEMADG